MTLNLAVVGSIINQCFTSPLRNISALNILEHAEKVKDGISAIENLRKATSSLESFILDPQPLFSFASNNDSDNGDKPQMQDRISHDLIVKTLKSHINESNKDFIINVV